MRLATAFSVFALLAVALVGVVLTMGRLAPGALGDKQLPAVATPDVAVRSVPVSLPRPKAPPAEQPRPQTVPAVVRAIPVTAPAVVRRPPAPPAPTAPVNPPVQPRADHGRTQGSDPQGSDPGATVPAPAAQTPAAPAQQSTPAVPASPPPVTAKVEPAPLALSHDRPLQQPAREAGAGTSGDDHRPHGRIGD